MKRELEPQPINVDGETYFWKLRHGWVTEQDIGAKGISVSVSLKPERTRELILDFAVTAFGRERNPQPAVLVAAMPAAIRAAIEAGWRPDSRGRTFRFAVPGPETALPE